MRFKAKDLVRILSAVDGDSDVIFHIDDDDNHRYSADSVTFKEGNHFDGDGNETDVTIHISVYYSGVYNPKLDDMEDEFDERALIERRLRECDCDLKATAKVLGISDRTLYRKIKLLNINTETWKKR